MPMNVVSDYSTAPRVQALKERHAALSEQIDEARKSLSTTDFYLNQLKKQKLKIKEKISAMEQGDEDGRSAMN